jgi:hypothetical protein
LKSYKAHGVQLAGALAISPDGTASRRVSARLSTMAFLPSAGTLDMQQQYRWLWMKPPERTLTVRVVAPGVTA